MDSDTQPVISQSETQHAGGMPNRFLKAGLIGLLLAAIFIVTLMTTAPMVIRSKKKSDLIEAANNARQIGLALLEFEQTYGDFPNEAISPEVTTNTGSTLILGSKYSNDYFRQLMAAEITQSEAMFYAKIPNTKKPDNVFKDAHALAKGECGFSYLIGATTKSPPETPVVVTPLVPGKALFDYKAAKYTLSEKAIVLCKDGSVLSLPIDKAGRVWINGKDLFDPSQPFWNGKAPAVKWPDL